MYNTATWAEHWSTTLPTEDAAQLLWNADSTHVAVLDTPMTHGVVVLEVGAKTVRCGGRERARSG